MYPFIFKINFVKRSKFTADEVLSEKAHLDRSVHARSSIRAVWESGAIGAKRGARLLNCLLRQAPVYKSEVRYERILKIL